MLPASMFGTSRMSALPATGERMFLVRAAISLMALSNASGPSRMAPRICSRSAILQSAAASSVDWMSGLTVSTAERMAIFGSCTPRARARSIAFCAMSAFSSSDGAMLIAASVTNRMRS